MQNIMNPGLVEVCAVAVALTLYLGNATLFLITRSQRFRDSTRAVWDRMLWRTFLLGGLVLFARLFIGRGAMSIYMLFWGWPPNLQACQSAAVATQAVMGLAFVCWFCSSLVSLFGNSSRRENNVFFWVVSSIALFVAIAPISAGLVMKFVPRTNPFVRQMVANIQDVEEFGRDEDIESLTVEEAEELLERRGGVTRGGISWPSDLRLTGLKSLTPEVAGLLAQHEGGLFLDGLEELSPETAQALAQKKEGSLRRSFTSTLSINGVSGLSVEIARALSTHKGDLKLNGLHALSASAAEALGKKAEGSHSRIELRGLTDLSNEAAKGLIGEGSFGLVLTGLRSPSIEVLSVLAKHKGMLALDGIMELPVGASKVLAGHEGSLSLNGLRTLSASDASEFEGHSGNLFLSGLTQIDMPVAQSLARHNGGVWLGGIEDANEDVVAALRASSEIRFPQKKK